MITPKMASSTSQAAPVCEPKKRDRRFSRFGEWLTRMVMNVAIEIRTATAKKSSMKPMTAVLPMRGRAKLRANRAPKASMIVRIRMVKPHMVKKWAMPGTVHWSSFFCPATSTSSALTRAGMSLTRLGHSGLTGSDEPAQPEEPSTRDGEHHERDDESDAESDGHCGSS